MIKFYIFLLLIISFNIPAQESELSNTSDKLLNFVLEQPPKDARNIDQKTFIQRLFMRFSYGPSFNRFDIKQEGIDNYAYFSKIGRVYNFRIQYILDPKIIVGLEVEKHNHNLIQKLEYYESDEYFYEAFATFNFLPTEVSAIIGRTDTSYLYYTNNSFKLNEAYNLYIGSKVMINFDLFPGSRIVPYVKYYYLFNTNDQTDVGGSKYFLGCDFIFFRYFGVSIIDEYSSLWVGQKIQRENAFKILTFIQI
jgi:hypothetical protein